MLPSASTVAMSPGSAQRVAVDLDERARALLVVAVVADGNAAARRQPTDLP